jgi:Fe-S cluster biogenesis protein NfuA
LLQPNDLKERVAHLLTQEVEQISHLDGGSLEVLDVTDGIVRIRLGRACGCCPITLMTIIHGLEQELRRRIPEVEYLEAVS